MALIVGTARRWQLGSVTRRKFLCKRTVTATLTCRHESTQHFPWRHSSEPMLYVVEGDNLPGIPVPKQEDSFFQEILMGSMLKRDWYELLFPWVWKESLASDCAWAFQKGLAALLAPTFQVPIHEIDKEEDGVVLDTESLSNTKGWTEEEAEESSKFVSQIFEKKLGNLYQHVDPSKIDLLLRFKPFQYRLEHVFVIMFTRETIAKDESLLEAGRCIRFASRVAKDPLATSRIIRDLDNKGKPIELFTIIADVSINCLETFQIKDKTTGEIISGSTEPEQVTHLVRFEVETSMGERWLRSWRIVDLDGMLEGNVWY